MKSPCKDCDRRYPGCHDHCEDFKAFRAEVERVKKIRGWAKTEQEYFGSLAMHHARKKRKK